MNTEETNTLYQNLTALFITFVLSIGISGCVGYRMSQDKAANEREIIYRDCQERIRINESNNQEKILFEITKFKEEAVKRGYAEWVMEYPHCFKFKWKE